MVSIAYIIYSCNWTFGESKDHRFNGFLMWFSIILDQMDFLNYHFLYFSYENLVNVYADSMDVLPLVG